jgi:hypothetical protein
MSITGRAQKKMAELDDVAGWVHVLRDATVDKARAESQIATARRHIEEALGDAEIGFLEGELVVRWTYVTTKRFDAKLARELLNPSQLIACTAEQQTRRFVLVDDL